MKLVVEEQHFSGDLPDNYLPVALGYLTGRETRSRLILEPGNLTLIPATAETLANPCEMANKTRDPDVFIGPFTEANRSLNLNEIPGAFESSNPIVVVVDIGIAFWDPSFTRNGAPLFDTVLSMDFDAPENGQNLVTKVWLRETEEGDRFFAKVENAYASVGNAAAIDCLAGLMPGSVYARKGWRPTLGASDFAHGTAMASLIVNGDLSMGVQEMTDDGQRTGANHHPSDLRMIAFELPAEAYFDRAGHALRAIIPAVVRQIAMLVDGHQGPVHIVLPYAFTRGPVPLSLDLGTVEFPWIDQVETELSDAGPDIKLWLPSGNFLQEQLSGELSDDMTICWSIPADDASPNTVSFFWRCHAAVPVRLSIQSPHGVIEINGAVPGKFFQIKDGDNVIGAAYTTQKNGTGRLRLSLAPTKVGQHGAKPGLYQLALDTGKAGTGIRAMIDRDDLPALMALGLSSPQSFFVDPGYARRDALGRFHLTDPTPCSSPIRRDGTASYLSLGERKNRMAVAATVKSPVEPTGERHADYASFIPAFASQSNLTAMQLGTFATPGVTVRSNGAGRFDRISGTSLAVALAVRAALYSTSSSPRLRNVSTG